MKKLLTAILIILLISTGAWAAGKGWVKQSTQKTADAAITTSGGLFSGVMVVPAATTGNSITIDIYDNATAASGTKLIPTTIIYTVATTTYSLPYTIIKPPAPVRFYNGLYVDVDVTNGTLKYMVYFETDK